MSKILFEKKNWKKSSGDALKALGNWSWKGRAEPHVARL
jgi:hypothetical protein